MVVAMVWRRRRWRVMIIMMVVVMVRLGRRLGCRLLHRLNNRGMAARECQQSCAAEKKGGEWLGSNHLSFSSIGADFVSSGEMPESGLAKSEMRAKLAHKWMRLRNGSWGDLNVQIEAPPALANG